MANWFVDTGLGTGANDGTSMDNAWQSLKTAMEYASFGPSDTIWIRRRSYYSSPSASITPTDDGDGANVLRFIGWPRAQHDISSSDWTNGSNQVVIDDANMDREAHQARYIIAPDGKQYLITRVIDASTINIDRPYPGTTVTNNATAYIKVDDYRTEAQAIDDSSWTIKKTDWNADPDTLPYFDFGVTGYYMSALGMAYTEWYHLELKGGTNADYGCLAWNSGNQFGALVGCLISQTNNCPSCYLAGSTVKRCTFEGSGSGSGQRVLYATTMLRLYDCAIYNGGGHGISSVYGPQYYENVNVGVELPNVGYDIHCNGQSELTAIDLKLGGTNGMFAVAGNYYGNWKIENFGKVLGTNLWATAGGYYIVTKTDVVAGSGDPYKRTGGSDSVVKIDPIDTTPNARAQLKAELCFLEYSIPVDTTSRTYRVYVQRSSITTLTKCYLEAFYVDSYDDASTYHTTVVVSDETVSERSGADDWSQYVEVVVQPAVASNIKLRLFASFTDTDGILYIDPLVEIS